MRNEPAFPWEDQDVCGNPMKRFHGLTKREYFAALAMQAIIPNYRTERSQDGDEAIADLSIRMADALIQELEKTK